MKYKVFLVSLLLVSICFFGCSANPEKHLDIKASSYSAAPSKCTDNLPVFSDFSGSVIDDSSLTFPTPQGAVLSVNGKTEEISPSDPRLIRLLNYILFSENEQLSGVTTGLLSEEDIQAYYDKCSVWLEVSFPANENRCFVPNLSEMVIFPNVYLLFGSQANTGAYVEEHFPYAALLQDWAEQHNEHVPEMINNIEEPWMNMLQIARVYGMK